MHTEVARDRETRPGAWVTSLLEKRAMSEEDLAVLVKRSASTVFRWRREGIDYIAWVGVLALLDEPLDWKPGDVDKPKGAKAKRKPDVEPRRR